MIDLLNKNELPDWFEYPQDFLAFVEKGDIDIGPWQLLEGKWLRVRNSGLKERFPGRNLVPFARRLDSDDLACWDHRAPSAVFLVHDFCAPDWEDRGQFDGFNQWLEMAKSDAEGWDE